MAASGCLAHSAPSSASLRPATTYCPAVLPKLHSRAPVRGVRQLGQPLRCVASDSVPASHEDPDVLQPVALQVASDLEYLRQQGQQDRELLERVATETQQFLRQQGAQDRLTLERVGRQAGSLLRTSKTRAWQDLHKPTGMALFPAWLLGCVAGITNLPGPHWAPVATGLVIGTTFAALNRFCQVRMHIAPKRALGVVLTGGSKGLGKALARELLLGGDKVLLTSRNQAGVEAAVSQLKEELGPDTEVFGCVCDVSDAVDVARLAETAQQHLGQVDVWINNAGFSGSFQPFTDTTSHQMEQVVRTNMLGSVLCTREAVRLFSKQEGGGHLFNVDGAGADGMPTPNYAVYGSTKAGIRQLSLSLQHELQDSPVRVHLLSPGMILTDLLLEGATTANKQAFNILCEQPETTAAFLGPRIRTIVARKLRDTYTKYLTPTSAIWRLLTAPARIGRYFDSAGNPVYPEQDWERIYGKSHKVTLRRISQARVQDGGLQLAYSFSLAAAVAAIVLESTLIAS